MEALGGKSLYVGRAKELLNGDEAWDIVMFVQYPSRKAFLKMANDPEYLKIHKFREDGLVRAVLYATEEISLERTAPVFEARVHLLFLDDGRL